MNKECTAHDAIDIRLVNDGRLVGRFCFVVKDDKMLPLTFGPRAFPRLVGCSKHPERQWSSGFDEAMGQGGKSRWDTR
jgi:hypothetical protein